jgi:hypothetical protein
MHVHIPQPGYRPATTARQDQLGSRWIRTYIGYFSIAYAEMAICEYFTGFDVYNRHVRNRNVIPRSRWAAKQKQRRHEKQNCPH